MDTSARLRFSWVLSPAKDMLFYIGSALAGWLYVGIILYAIYRLTNPLEDAFASLTIGQWTIPLNLQLLVIVSWAFILDAPHVWATLGRTLFDPDEWQVRRKEILFSFVWFAVGPIAILLPYMIGAGTSYWGTKFTPGQLAFGALIFFAFFRLWAYYHVVRQHWGFFMLYKRKAQEQEKRMFQIDYWFFHLSLYLPLLMFMSSPYYTSTPGFPNLGLHHPLYQDWSIASVLYPITWYSFFTVVIGYCGYQIYLWQQKTPVNVNKLLYMLLIVPLHFLVFTHPILVIFVVPIVTVGHNIQYHCIVYSFAQNKYPNKEGSEYRWVKMLFKNFLIYSVVGLVFTFLFYRGPWIHWLKGIIGINLDEVLLNSLGMMAGIANPEKLGLGEQIFAAFIVGFAMQHYYLDSKIWRVSKDKQVQKHLKV